MPPAVPTASVESDSQFNVSRTPHVFQQPARLSTLRQLFCTKGIRNREKRIALARASGLLQQLTSSLRPLATESAEPELVAETLPAAV
jgi:hypothetical protein